MGHSEAQKVRYSVDPISHTVLPRRNSKMLDIYESDDQQDERKNKRML